MGLSRRHLLMAGGGLAALAAVPTAQQVMWSTRDFTRPDYEPDLPEAPAGRVGWMNWSGIERATPERIAVPATEDELSEILRGTNGPVRAVGSGHSFTGLVPCQGIIVDVSRMSGLLSHDAAQGTVTFGAGTRLRQAAREMAEIGLAWPNQPDIDIQTLAGSFATATHGTGLSLAAIHDQIIGFRLVTANGDVREVTAKSDPELFSAGKVSLGALGIITQYTMKMVPSFTLRRRVFVEKIDDLLDRAEDLADSHRNFEFFYLPGSGYAAVITHDLHNGAAEGPGAGDDDEILEELKQVRDLIGWWPWLRRLVLGASLPKGVIEDVTDESWRLLSTARPVKFNEMEYHVPYEKGIKGVRDTVAFLDARRDTFFPAEFRWTGPDDAMLSPFNDGPRVSLSTHTDVAESYQYFFEGLEPLHRAKGGRPHWGKLHSLGRADLVALYPDFERFLEIRRDIDPGGKFVNSHLTRLFGQRFEL